MATEHKKRLDEVMSAARARPEAERRAVLEDACRGDDKLLEEALAMLALGCPSAPCTDRPPPERPPTAELPGGKHLTNPQPLVGRRRLGAYKIVGRAGSGGMGQVYIGEDRQLGRKVAIKTLRSEVAEDAERLERFKREARALAALNHPNIVTIHSIEEDDGVVFLTMELVDGKTLGETIPGGGLAVDELLRIAAELTDALVAAHGRGIVHRDLKPNNVMITGEGRTKVLDFGIAKVSGHEITGPQNDRLLGTMSYMAPEQLKGGPVDTRADIFSFGIMLHMMATGRHPFPGENPYQRVLAIVHARQPPATKLRPDLPIGLATVIDRCLEKKPELRYQDTAELRIDLAGLQENQLAERILESRTELRAFRSSLVKRPKVRWPVAVASIAVVAALVAGLLWKTRNSPLAGEGTSQALSTTLAVLSFRNLTSDPEAAWLATGITELLITDVSQSPQLRVLRSIDLQQALAEVGANEPGELSPEVRRRVVEAGATAVVYGSYARLGDLLRIHYSIDNPSTGDTIRSDSLERRGETSLFSLVDQISAAVLESCQASRPGIGPDRIQEATTGSLLAWQAYSEAQILYLQQSRPEQALAKLEEALRIDPAFALAYVDASRIHNSLGHVAKGQEYSQQAFDLVERLPLFDRFNVEAGYYSGRWAAIGRAIESYAMALRVYPLTRHWRNNLARCLAFFEMYPESLESFRTLIGPGEGFWGNFGGAANVYAALGDFDTGHQLLVDFAQRQPDSWRSHFSLAWHLTEWGRYQEAAAAFDRAAGIRPEAYQITYGRWRLAVMDEQWHGADDEARQLLESDDSFARWWGPIALAQNALYRGRAEEARSWLDAAINASVEANRAFARCLTAELLLALGESEPALGHAQEAQTEGIEQWPELRGLFLAAQAEQALGRPLSADALQDALRTRWLRQPNTVEERQLRHLSGLLALARGEAQEGVLALQQAENLLPPRGVEFHWHVYPAHVPIWVDLAEAELAAGHAQQALGWLRQVTESGSEHLMYPVPFIRAFYLQGIAHSLLGEHDAAHHSFERFLSYWGGGDLERDAVAAAHAYVTAEESPPAVPPLISRWPETGSARP